MWEWTLIVLCFDYALVLCRAMLNALTTCTIPNGKIAAARALANLTCNPIGPAHIQGRCGAISNELSSMSWIHAAQEV